MFANFCFLTSFFITFLFLTITVLHENELTHTDLKPENILFCSSEFDTELTRKVRYFAINRERE